MQAVILIGIQATGKTTFYRERFFESHLRLSLDMLRTRFRERILLEACLTARQPFVVDNTNVTVEERARYILPARDAGFRVLGYFFPCGVREAIGRDAQRAAATGARPLPPIGIAGTFKRLQPPAAAEGFDELSRVVREASGHYGVYPF